MSIESNGYGTYVNIDVVKMYAKEYKVNKIKLLTLIKRIKGEVQDVETSS